MFGLLDPSMGGYGDVLKTGQWGEFGGILGTGEKISPWAMNATTPPFNPMGRGHFSSQIPVLPDKPKESGFWDFSLSGLKNKIDGFDLGSMSANPAVMMGLGLLGSKKGDGANAAMRGLLSAQQQQGVLEERQVKQAERERQEAERKARDEALRQAQEAAQAQGNIPDYAVPLMGNPDTAKYGFNAVPNVNNTTAPSNVREYQYYNSLPPDQQKAYLNMKRAGQQFNAGGVPYYIAPGSQTPRTLVDPNTVAATAAQQAAAKASAAEIGKDAGQNQANLGSTVAKAQEALALIDKMKTHPGREKATGGSSVLNLAAWPGSERQDFLTMQDQLKGKVFMEAYQGLKGGGQITEIEGVKAEQAIARLNTAQSEGAYLAALDELRTIIEQGMRRAEGKAGVAPQQGNTPTVEDLVNQYAD